MELQSMAAGSILHLGDCLEILPTLPENSVDSIVTDPPYGLSFMGKEWDHGVPGEAFWREALRVAKPGAHLLAFGGTRTFHRLAVAIEDAGWEIRDTVMWVYGSGFPKSLDVSKAIDKAAGVEREDKFEGAFERRAGPTGNKRCDDCGKWLVSGSPCQCPRPQDAPQTETAQQWSGWGTALKPAWEPVIVARKPLIGTVAENVLKHGAGAMNIDGCRVATDDVVTNHSRSAESAISKGKYGDSAAQETHQTAGQALGRWPANLIHDGGDEVVSLFPSQKSGANPTRRGSPKFRNAYGEFTGQEECEAHRGAESGSAARFFYCAKASKRDRDEGLELAEPRVLARSCQAVAEAKRGNTVDEEGGAFNKARVVKNNHPTVKPTDLMRYLCRLVTPPGGTVLDPFMGSGSTGKAAMLEGFNFVGIELEQEYIDIARARIGHAQSAPVQGALF